MRGLGGLSESFLAPESYPRQRPSTLETSPFLPTPDPNDYGTEDSSIEYGHEPVHEPSNDVRQQPYWREGITEEDKAFIRMLYKLMESREEV